MVLNVTGAHNIFFEVIVAMKYLYQFRFLQVGHYVIPHLTGLHFPGYRLNTERYRVSLRIQCEYGKMRTRITPNTGTFHAAVLVNKGATENNSLKVNIPLMIM